MRLLILGGTGLISTAITRELSERGDEVVLFNRGQRDADVPAGVERIQGDRRDFAAFEARMQALGNWDCVIDMIGYTPPEAESLARAFAGRIGHLVFCSTVDVYAKPASRYPITEDEPHRPPAWDYAQNKAVCEAILAEAHARGDFLLTVLRPAHTYGEGSGLIHSFGGSATYFDRLRKGKPIVVHGDGQSLWASCHRDDVARGFVAAAGNPRVFGKSYHLTGEEWLTWNRYHETVAEALDAPAPRLVHIPTDLLARVVPERAGICAVNFQYNNIFDNTAARRDLGFRYTVPFRDGARRVIAWLDAHNRIGNSDDDPREDRVIAAWERCRTAMAEELAPGGR